MISIKSYKEKQTKRKPQTLKWFYREAPLAGERVDISTDTVSRNLSSEGKIRVNAILVCPCI